MNEDYERIEWKPVEQFVGRVPFYAVLSYRDGCRDDLESFSVGRALACIHISPI